jgi:putative CocE/NonD family hydrolase
MPKTILVERDVETPMRDGTILRADVYRPQGAGRYPVLLERTPYGKGFSMTSFAMMAAERGYAVVVQDTRGRWAADGASMPFIFEKEDGYDSVEWASRQPWSDGKVGMYGASYVGYTQLAAASACPPSLKAIIPAVTFSNPYCVFYQGGAVELGISASWTLMAWVMMEIMRRPASPEQKQAWMGALIAAADGMTDGSTFRSLPLDRMPMLERDGLAPFFTDALDHPDLDAFWRRAVCAYEDIRVPALHVGGWYDTFVANTLSDYAGIRQAGNPLQKVLVGPWTHASFRSLSGEVDFGMQASDALVLPYEVMLRWLDYWLKGTPNGVMEEPPVRLYVMGENRWRDEQEFPLARTKYTPCYLHSGGAANSLHGDGALSFARPGDEPADSFLYDPRNPVPTRGGPVLGWDAIMPPGAYDQRQIEARPDVLVYSTSPLEADLEVTGFIQMHLWAASSAPSTDFTARLIDVRPDGFAHNVQEGITRVGLGSPLAPGRPVEVVIEMDATSNVFKAGHRLRLEVSSSNFPRFDRNLNTGQPGVAGSETRPALQTIFHDTEHPAHILLPVIPR